MGDFDFIGRDARKRRICARLGMSCFVSIEGVALVAARGGGLKIESCDQCHMFKDP
jgi:hypothetical protein